MILQDIAKYRAYPTGVPTSPDDLGTFHDRKGHRPTPAP